MCVAAFPQAASERCAPSYHLCGLRISWHSFFTLCQPPRLGTPGLPPDFDLRSVPTFEPPAEDGRGEVRALGDVPPLLIADPQVRRDSPHGHRSPGDVVSAEIDPRLSEVLRSAIMMAEGGSSIPRALDPYRICRVWASSLPLVANALRATCGSIVPRASIRSRERWSMCSYAWRSCSSDGIRVVTRRRTENGQWWPTTAERP